MLVNNSRQFTTPPFIDIAHLASLSTQRSKQSKQTGELAAPVSSYRIPHSFIILQHQRYSASEVEEEHTEQTTTT